VSYVARFGRFWWDFIVGDDWIVAATVFPAIGITYWLAHDEVNAWWLVPVVVVVTLYISIRRAIRPRQR
jgi:hypothetical protein